MRKRGEREPARTSCHRLIDSRQACSCLVPFCKWRSCNIPTTDVTANLLMRRPLLLGFPPDFFWCHCRPPNRVADTSDKVTLYEDLFRVGDEEYANESEAAPKVRWPPQTEKEGFTEERLHNEADWRRVLKRVRGTVYLHLARARRAAAVSQGACPFHYNKIPFWPCCGMRRFTPGTTESIALPALTVPSISEAPVGLLMS